MNYHLKPIFQIVLPEIEKNGMDYWVYGGISIAAYAGMFVRYNKDVDIFVRNTDFENIKSILSNLCKQNGFSLKLIREDERPKIEIKIAGEERFSMIPIYEEGNSVIFKYPKRYGGNELYSNIILEKVERNISGYKFFTSHDKFIKEMFKNHIKARPDKKMRKEFQIDAKAILSLEEFSTIFNSNNLVIYDRS